jgi:peptidylprolyl isomerase
VLLCNAQVHRLESDKIETILRLGELCCRNAWQFAAAVWSQRAIFTKKRLMKIPFSAGALRLILLGGLASASVLPFACKKDDTTEVKDYSAIDDAIIQKYLTDNAITNAQKQPSGLYYVPIVSAPNGIQAAAGKTASVLYTGRYIDGRVFDSSIDPTKPFKFVLGGGFVITGWDIGIALMRKGEKGLLLIPSALAYGPKGSGPIPPNTVLRFEVELTNVQ